MYLIGMYVIHKLKIVLPIGIYVLHDLYIVSALLNVYILPADICNELKIKYGTFGV